MMLTRFIYKFLPQRETMKRGAATVSGLVIFGCGLALLFLADLGVGPWDVLHDGLANHLNRSPGTIIISLGVLLLVFLFLFRQPLGPATIANVVIIGLVLDLVMRFVETPESFIIRLMMTSASPIVVGLGSMFYLGAGLGVGPRDGLMTALIERGQGVAKARTVIEAAIFVGGVLLGGSYGIGTLIFAFGVGPSYQFFKHQVWAGWPESTRRYVYRR